MLDIKIIKKSHVLYTAFLMAVVLTSNAEPFNESVFIQKIKEKGEQYRTAYESIEAEKRFTEGQASQVTKQLLEHVPDSKKTAEDYFILGNMLYKIEPKKSYELMKQASTLSPGNNMVAYELAMNEHRLGNYTDALSLYYKSAESAKLSQSATLWAYITHCQLMLGHYKQAISAWKKVNFREHHTAIESAMYEIFSSSNPESERELLILELQKGSLNSACKLAQLDKSWEIDWWNVVEKKEYLKHDEKLIRDIVAQKPDWKDTVNLCLNGSSLSDTEFKALLKNAGFWEPHNTLPKSSIAAHVIVRELIKRKISEPKEILKRYENQLIEIVKSNPTDTKMLDLLAYLYANTDNKNKLKSIDLHGWKDLRIQKYAESYITGLAISDVEYADTVSKAAKDFPNSTIIQGTNLRLHFNSSEKNSLMMKYAASQFAEVGSPKSQFRLNDYMASLESEIEKN